MRVSAADIVRVYKAALAGLRRRRRFVPYHESSRFAGELRELIAGLPADIDPREGVSLITAFFRADGAVLNICDDSNGYVGDAFRDAARARFVEYAARCDDKRYVADVVYRLLEDDDFGVRDSVLDGARSYLDEASLRRLADRWWSAVSKDRSPNGRGPRHSPRDGRLYFIEAIALELKDAGLFERARLANQPEPGTAACTAIANAWLEADDPVAALAWLDRVPAAETFMADDRDLVRAEVYRRLGRHEEQADLLRRRLLASPSPASLDAFLEVAGTERRAEVLEETAKRIANSPGFDSDDVAFLLHLGEHEAAATYVVQREASLNGDAWHTLAPLAPALAEAGAPLAATALYRALLDSILKRAQTATYGHGAGYWRKLERLARTITEWHGLRPHEEYAAGLREAHRLKKSFWKRLETTSI